MPYLVFLLALAFAAAPLLTPGFGGFDPDRFPVPQDNPPVQPAGYAFSIWGLIYLWLIAGAAFGLLRRRTAPEWQAMRPPLALSLAVGGIWLLVALQSPIWATVSIWMMLAGAVLALNNAPRSDRPWAAWPIGLYAGWLTAASSVSLGLLLAGYGWLAQDTAAYLALLVGLCLGVGMQLQFGHAPSYGLAVIWALIAVAVQNEFDPVSPAALALVGALIVLYSVFRARV